MKTRLLIIGAIVLLALAVVPQIASAAAFGQAETACTQGDSARVVASSFAMSRGSDYRVHIPRMGLAPELDNDQPAYVFVFAGSVNLTVEAAPMVPEASNGTVAGPTTTSADFTGVVCIVQDGVPNFYTNVDTTAATP